mmetsp:Transcript_9815/g.9651  ORF Transcript_9815/g.9651 Transcript_9815/m.9651 type:complete len:210 (-) Transcript_9815:716-1345(-)
MNFSDSSDFFFGFDLGLFYIHFCDDSNLINLFINFNNWLHNSDFFSSGGDYFLLLVNNRHDDFDFFNDLDFISLHNFLVGGCSINSLNDINGLSSDNIHSSGYFLDSGLNVHSFDHFFVNSSLDRLSHINLHSLNFFYNLVLSLHSGHCDVNHGGSGHSLLDGSHSRGLHSDFRLHNLDLLNSLHLFNDNFFDLLSLDSDVLGLNCGVD